MPDKDTVEPFQILVVGDFSGRGNRGVHLPVSGQHAIPVDLDNFDEVLARLRPSLQLPHVTVDFESLDDFNPDRIYERTELFQKLAELRSRAPELHGTGHSAAGGLTSAAPTPDLLNNLISETEERLATQPSEDMGGSQGIPGESSETSSGSETEPLTRGVVRPRP